MSKYLDIEVVRKGLKISGHLLGRVDWNNTFVDEGITYISCSYLRHDELDINTPICEAELIDLDCYTYIGYWRKDYLETLLKT